MQNFDLENIKSHPSLSLAKAKASRDLQINFNQAEDALTISTKSRGDNKCGSATQSGRSMIEMLGVLAIIGVLSVGGIAGYSKAMMKYRINKTIEEITITAGNIRTFFKNELGHIGLSDQVVAIKKAKLVPDVEKLEGNTYTLPLGEMDIQGQSDFEFELYNIPVEACIELATYDWSTVSVNRFEFNCNNCVYQPPMKLDDAVDVCTKTQDNDGTVSEWYFIFKK